ncbi:MAG: hypothetical protein EOP42_02640 [Sphingobacteriaceae bacterium]|nr:MAG: hypothetical protein EOP42_02640 [Sphingobacteriaceae bacterium]
MKIIKYISTVFTAVFLLSITSCTKKADVDVTEAKLPAIQLSSLGYQQSSPFSSNTILQLSFGATTTNLKTGRFTVEILNGTSATSAVLRTVTFNSWSGYDVTSTPATTPAVLNHSITYAAQPTTYSNTTVYSGNILLKLSLLNLTPNSTYSVRITGYSADGTKNSSYTQLSFFRTAA